MTGTGGFRQPRELRFRWNEAPVCLHVIPAEWIPDSEKEQENGVRRRLVFWRRRMVCDKIRRYVSGKAPKGEDIWLSPELEPLFLPYARPLPDPELAARLLHNLPFKEILVLLTDLWEDDRIRWWQERFLENCFQNLNALYLVGDCGTQMRPFYDWMYEQSGLLACPSHRFPETDGRKTAVVDLRFSKRPPIRELAEGSLYLDLTSQPEKQRLFGEKRRDISYVSARNYLDTAFKARYNAM